MNSILLEDDEIIAINSFVYEISENIITDGVLFFPYKDFNNNISIKIIVIRNISLQYTTKVLGTNTIPKRSTKLKEISTIVSKYNTLFKGKRLSFEITNMDDYNVTLLHEKELRNMRTLLSSTILFDRFGDIIDRQKRQIKYISKFKYIPTVENIESIISNDGNKIKIKES